MSIIVRVPLKTGIHYVVRQGKVAPAAGTGTDEREGLRRGAVERLGGNPAGAGGQHGPSFVGHERSFPRRGVGERLPISLSAAPLSAPYRCLQKPKGSISCYNSMPVFATVGCIRYRTQDRCRRAIMIDISPGIPSQIV